ncbi:MAG: hypothetical protein NZV14_12820 [Bryobacteraceae bacterium]|nr:hypothetical protein [Bryobacteraceae bacterium]MDW8379038.1 hypothetical protein [Bryobacterales bacterium]
MRSIKERLEQGVLILEILDGRRDKTSTPTLGRDMEWSLIERELRELEEDILADPGALEKFLVRKRQSDF